MPGLLGKKIGMTSYFVEDGKSIPVTVIEAGPCQIVNIKTKERDGYESLTLGFEKAKEKNLTKPEAIAYKKKKLTPSKYLKEFRNFDISVFEIGKEVTVDLFKNGEKVKVSVAEVKVKVFKVLLSVTVFMVLAVQLTVKKIGKDTPVQSDKVLIRQEY